MSQQSQIFQTDTVLPYIIHEYILYIIYTYEKLFKLLFSEAYWEQKLYGGE